MILPITTVDNFWDAKVAWYESGDLTPDGSLVAHADGAHYILGAPMPDAPASWKGYAGSRFQVTFICGPHAGKVIVTDNLWCQGSIPDEYLDRLPPNAIVEPFVARGGAPSWGCRSGMST